MSSATRSEDESLEQARVSVARRLRARRGEIDDAILARVSDAAFGQHGADEAEYVAGLRTAVVAAVELGIVAIERGEATMAPIPAATVEQARRAARFGVSLDTVLRRYIAGHALLADFIMEEADHSDYAGDEAALRHQLRLTQTPLLERLTAAIVEEYNQELDRVGCSPELRRAELVSRLLAGEQLDASHPAELNYDFQAWHVGVIAVGARITDFVRGVKAALGCEQLAVSHGEQTAWVWLGRRRRPTAAEVKRLSIERPTGVSLALGEPRRGIEGWRLTHREARAGLMVALRKPPGLTRGSDVLLEAAILQQDGLVCALSENFLAPLEDMGDHGRVAHETLRAYFELKRNVSSTANRLGVARNTVENRLHEIEQRLGRPLHTCSAQLEVALKLQALSDAGEIDRGEPGGQTWADPFIAGPPSGPVEKMQAAPRAVEQPAQTSRLSLSTLAIHSPTPG